MTGPVSLDLFAERLDEGFRLQRQGDDIIGAELLQLFERRWIAPCGNDAARA